MDWLANLMNAQRARAQVFRMLPVFRAAKSYVEASAGYEGCCDARDWQGCDLYGDEMQKAFRAMKSALDAAEQGSS